jgi:hypothetical protein
MTLPSSNAYATILEGPSKGQHLGRLEDVASAGFEGFKTTLRLVERSTDVFTPLKSAVAGFLGILEILEVLDIYDRPRFHTFHTELPHP